MKSVDDLRRRAARTAAATGVELAPLPGGDVLVEFFGEDGRPMSSQVVTMEVVASLPLVSAALGAALRDGPDAARAFLARGQGQMTSAAGTGRGGP